MVNKSHLSKKKNYHQIFNLKWADFGYYYPLFFGKTVCKCRRANIYNEPHACIAHEGTIRKRYTF